jgi:hypothetical protein
MAIFVVWVVSPFVALAIADKLSTTWPPVTRATLYSMMLFVALGSLVTYGHDALHLRLAQAAFVYVIVPPLSCLFTVTALAITARLSDSERG